MQKVKNISPVISVIAMLLFLVVGILMIVIPEVMLSIFIYLTAAIIVVLGVGQMVELWGQSLKKRAVAVLLLYILVAVAVLVLWRVFLGAINIVLAVIALALAVIRLGICIQYAILKIRGAFRNGLSALLCGTFAVILFCQPVGNSDVVAFVFGIYCILYAVMMLLDIIAEFMKTDLAEDKVKRRIHIALPNFITALIPARVIDYINESFKQNEIQENIIRATNGSEGQDHVDLEIFIHMQDGDAVGKLGHADLCIDGTVYSYGCYDTSKNRLGGFLSQGTVAISPREPYIRHCTVTENKYLVGFGVCLSEVQKAAVLKQLEELMSNCEKLETEYEKAVARGEDGMDAQDPASGIVRDVGGEVYNVVTGPFRVYMAVSTNCVQLADWVTGPSGLDLMAFNGIRTPGAFYSILNDMFERNNTIVIERTVYLDRETREKSLAEEERKKQEKKEHAKKIAGDVKENLKEDIREDVADAKETVGEAKENIREKMQKNEK